MGFFLYQASYRREWQESELFRVMNERPSFDWQRFEIHHCVFEVMTQRLFYCWSWLKSCINPIKVSVRNVSFSVSVKDACFIRFLLRISCKCAAFAEGDKSMTFRPWKISTRHSKHPSWMMWMICGIKICFVRSFQRDASHVHSQQPSIEHLRAMSVEPRPFCSFRFPRQYENAFPHHRQCISNLSAIIRSIEERLLWQLVLWKSTSHITSQGQWFFMLLQLLHYTQLLC